MIFVIGINYRLSATRQVPAAARKHIDSSSDNSSTGRPAVAAARTTTPRQRWCCCRCAAAAGAAAVVLLLLSPLIDCGGAAMNPFLARSEHRREITKCRREITKITNITKIAITKSQITNHKKFVMTIFVILH